MNLLKLLGKKPKPKSEFDPMPLPKSPFLGTKTAKPLKDPVKSNIGKGIKK
jgi:hypothetical protein